jgi:hypothetical protein
MKRLVASVMVIAALSSCRRAKPSSHDSSSTQDKVTTHDSSAKDDLSARIRRSELQAAEREGERVCERPIAVYEGSIAVDRSDYQHPVARGADFVDEPIDGLDRVLSKSTRVRFTLDYPFERPFAGVVTGEITLRRTIDAIRAGFRTMYEGTTQRDIPRMYNKEVTGPYGWAFHVIGDLVIEHIELCADDTLSITIGS